MQLHQLYILHPYFLCISNLQFNKQNVGLNIQSFCQRRLQKREKIQYNVEGVKLFGEKNWIGNDSKKKKKTPKIMETLLFYIFLYLWHSLVIKRGLQGGQLCDDGGDGGLGGYLVHVTEDFFSQVKRRHNKQHKCAWMYWPPWADPCLQFTCRPTESQTARTQSPVCLHGGRQYRWAPWMNKDEERQMVVINSSNKDKQCFKWMHSISNGAVGLCVAP